MMMNKIMISILLATSLYCSEAFAQVSIGRATPAISTAPTENFSRGTGNQTTSLSPEFTVVKDSAPAATSTPPSIIAGSSRQVSGQANPDEIVDPVPTTLKVFKTWEEMDAYFKTNDLKLERKIVEQE